MKFKIMSCLDCYKKIRRTPNRKRCEGCAAERNQENMRRYSQTNDGRRACLRSRRKYRQSAKFRAATHAYNDRVKRECLSHYGKRGRMVCRYQGCVVDDIDVLTLDHIKDDGAEHRHKNKNKLGKGLYSQLRSQGYPEGYQTMCANHQLKKEILRRIRRRI